MQLLDQYVLRSDKVNFIIKEETKSYRSNRQFKDSVFRLLFSEKDTALELMNALEGTDYAAAEDMEIVTLEDAIYNRMINDLALRYTSGILSMVEHQSTWSENMPLRELLYLGRMYEKLLDNRSAYKNGLYRIPTPHLHVLYNGIEERPIEIVQNLEDSFSIREENPMLRLSVRVININYHKKHPILQRSRNLKEYAQFTARVRDNMRSGMDRDEAIGQAIRTSIRDGILETFLIKHGSEVHNMLFTEVTDEDIMEIRAEEAAEIAITKEREKIAIKLLRKNRSTEEIHELTEIPVEEILELRDKIKM